MVDAKRAMKAKAMVLIMLDLTGLGIGLAWLGLDWIGCVVDTETNDDFVLLSRFPSHSQIG